MSTGSRVGCHSTPSKDRVKRRGERGFTLLETLTALAILALAMASLFGIFSNNLRAVRTSGHYSKALTLAQSLLAEQITQPITKPRKQSGESEGFRWSLSVAPEAKAAPNADTMVAWRLYRVVVDVTNPSGRRIRLETLKLGARNAKSS